MSGNMHFLWAIQSRHIIRLIDAEMKRDADPYRDWVDHGGEG